MDCFLTTFWVLDMRVSLTLAHLQRVRGAVETLLSALTPISQAKSHKNKVQPTMMNAYLLSKDEQNISLLLNLLFPLLYQEGVQNTLFRWRRIFGWMLNGLASSVIIFFPLHQSIRPRSIQ